MGNSEVGWMRSFLGRVMTKPSRASDHDVAASVMLPSTSRNNLTLPPLDSVFSRTFSVHSSCAVPSRSSTMLLHQTWTVSAILATWSRASECRPCSSVMSRGHSGSMATLWPRVSSRLRNETWTAESSFFQWSLIPIWVERDLVVSVRAGHGSLKEG